MKKRIAALVLTILFTFSVGIKFKDIFVNENLIMQNAQCVMRGNYTFSSMHPAPDYGLIDQ